MFASENGLQGDPRLKAISEAIRVIPHFPKPGIMFQDITTLLLDHKAFKDTVDIFVDRYRDMGISVVAGVEARGFMFGPAIALAIGAKFVPLRKPKKLPGEVIFEEYVLEYGTDCLEMHLGAVQLGERVLVIDDLVAKGGTLSAAMRLLERVGAEVVECACVIGLPEFKLLESALDECGNDINAAIKRLHELSLGYTAGNANSAEESNANMERGTTTTDRDTAPTADPSVQDNLPMGGAEWVELFVREMMSATSIDDARSRATRVLESLEKSISERASAEATQSYHKEHVMLREQFEVALRENTILKRAVAIQHERQKEYDDRNQEVQHLKQMLSQYQEQLRILEVNNYALTMHLRQAQQSNNSIPGCFNPDVF